MSETADLFRDLARHDREQRAALRDAEALKVNEYSLRSPRIDVEWFTPHHCRITVGKPPRTRSADYWPSTGRWRPSLREHEESARHGTFEAVQAWLEGGP